MEKNTHLLKGLHVVLPKGDLYEGTIRIMYKAGVPLRSDIDGSVLTGHEPRDKMPADAYIADSDSIFSLLRPQDHWSILTDSEEPVDLLVTGYDCIMDRSRIEKPRLNGQQGALSSWEHMMKEELERIGLIELANLRFKPSAMGLLTSRERGIRTLGDLRNYSENNGSKPIAASEYAHLMASFLSDYDIPGEVAPITGSEESMARYFPVVTTVSETGSSIVKRLQRLALIRNDCNGNKPVVITRSTPCAVATAEAYEKNKDRMDELAYRLKTARDELLDEDPGLFDEKYQQFFKYYDDIEERKLAEAGEKDNI